MIKAQAIFKLYPQVVTVRDGVAYDANENVVEYDLSLVDAETARTEYQRLRAPEYPSIGDQLDALFKAGAFPADMAAKIQAVKDKYPKV